MTDPTTGNDEPLDAALRGMPRPAVDPARREAHIAAALGVLAETQGSSNVVSLASRRRPRLATLTAVAAAGLLAVGVGIGRVSAPDAPSSGSQVKNASLTTVARSAADTGIASCPDLAPTDPGQVVAEFGTYVLLRQGDADTGELVVVDTASCSIVTRIDLAATGG